MIIPRNKSIEMSRDLALEQTLEVILSYNINILQYHSNLILGQTCQWKHPGLGNSAHKYLAKS